MYVKCGTPKDTCVGRRIDASAGLGKSTKVHLTHLEAYRCYTRYLRDIGYSPVGGHAFKRGDEPILVVTRQSKYGARLRTGGVDKSRRAIPRGRPGMSGLVIIG